MNNWILMIYCEHTIYLSYPKYTWVLVAGIGLVCGLNKNGPYRAYIVEEYRGVVLGELWALLEKVCYWKWS